MTSMVMDNTQKKEYTSQGAIFMVLTDLRVLYVDTRSPNTFLSVREESFNLTHIMIRNTSPFSRLLPAF